MEEYSFWMPPFRGTAIPAAISDFDADDDRFESFEMTNPIVPFSFTRCDNANPNDRLVKHIGGEIQSHLGCLPTHH